MEILVAHRDAGLRARLRALLEHAGHLVGEADGPRDALTACREHDPDVLLLEFRDGGPEALRAVKTDRDEFSVAVVLVGGEQDLADPLPFLEAGAHDVLLEPVRDAEVVACCRAGIKVRHLQEAVLDLDRTVEELSHIDPLTGLYNRRFVFEQLTAQTNGALRHDRPLALVAIDIDRLPQIDARLGCRAGDEAIRTVAARIARRLRDEDVPARVGREEFLVLLPETCGTEAACVAEALRTEVRSEDIELAPGERRRVTISLGWAELDHLHPDDFLEQADQALCRAKRGGCDQVCGPLALPGPAAREHTTPLPPPPRRFARQPREPRPGRRW